MKLPEYRSNIKGLLIQGSKTISAIALVSGLVAGCINKTSAPDTPNTSTTVSLEIPGTAKFQVVKVIGVNPQSIAQVPSRTIDFSSSHLALTLGGVGALGLTGVGVIAATKKSKESLNTEGNDDERIKKLNEELNKSSITPEIRKGILFKLIRIYATKSEYLALFLSSRDTLYTKYELTPEEEDELHTMSENIITQSKSRKLGKNYDAISTPGGLMGSYKEGQNVGEHIGDLMNSIS